MASTFFGVTFVPSPKTPIKCKSNLRPANSRGQHKWSASQTCGEGERHGNRTKRRDTFRCTQYCWGGRALASDLLRRSPGSAGNLLIHLADCQLRRPGHLRGGDPWLCVPTSRSVCHFGRRDKSVRAARGDTTRSSSESPPAKPEASTVNRSKR